MIDAEKAAAVIGDIAGRLGVSPVKAARGIATSNMSRAIRAVSTRRGHDPRDFTLMPFDGAGGLHAADVVRLLSISRILVPRAACWKPRCRRTLSPPAGRGSIPGAE